MSANGINIELKKMFWFPIQKHVSINFVKMGFKPKTKTQKRSFVFGTHFITGYNRFSVRN